MATLPSPVLASDPEMAAAVEEGFARPVPGLTVETASPSIAELVDVIGEEATLVLCERLGGISREIGKPSQEFIDAIGAAKARALRDYWGRGRIYIPRKAMSPKARHERIRALARAGLTRSAIARQMGISERQVYNVLAIARLAAPVRAPALPAP